MKRLMVLFLLLLAPTAHAQILIAPVPSISRTGTAAVAWADTDGVKVSVGTPGALGAPVTVGGRPLQLWVAALPAGGARVAWTDERINYESAAPSRDLFIRSATVAADGTVSPAEDVTPRLGTTTNPLHPVATDENGDVLVVWGDASLSVAGAPFTSLNVAAAADALPALSANGTAMIASGYTARIRPHGGVFGSELVLPVGASAISVADDGTATVSGDGQYAIRPAGGAFGAPAAGVAVQARKGGGAIVTTAGPTVVDVAANGTTTPTPLDAPYGTAAFTQDGSALLGLAGPAVRGRTGTGTFGAPMTLGSDGSVPQVALSSGGQLAVWVERNADIHVPGQTLAHYETAHTSPADPILPVVLPGKIRVQKRLAAIPLRCDGGCDATVSVRGGGRKAVTLADGFPTVVKVKAPAYAHRLRIVVSVGGQRVTTKRAATRTSTRPKRCRAAKNAATIATGGGSQLLASEAGIDRVVVGCTGVTSRRVLKGPNPLEVVAAAVHGSWAATVSTFPFPDSPLKLRRYDLENGATSEQLLSTPSDTLGYTINRLLLNGDGELVIVDTFADRVRIRTPVRVLDAEPGIDIDSVRITSTSVTWTRNGVQQTARLG